MLTQVLYKVTQNDVDRKIVHLTQIQDYLPPSAYVEGDAPDPADPPKGRLPISISWDGNVSRHWVSKAHGHATMSRSDELKKFFDLGIASGDEIIIEVPRVGEVNIRRK